MIEYAFKQLIKVWLFLFLSQIRLVYGFVYIQNFKTLDELIMFDDSLVESEKDIAVLLRIKLDPITESEIYVIESFFKK
jgi:hypothetical protein